MAKTSEQKDFFISYNRTDKDWAEWLAWQLEGAGYSTIIQSWDFKPGGNFVLDMQKAAVNCKRTLAVLSPNYLSSNFTAPEWAAAFVLDSTSQNQKLLPVRVKECNPPGLLSPIVYIDLVGKNATAARKLLLEAVKEGRLKPARPVPYPGEKAGKKVTPPPFPAVQASKATVIAPSPTTKVSRAPTTALAIKKEELSPTDKHLAETRIKKALEPATSRSNSPGWLKIVWAIPGSEELLDPVRFSDKKFRETVLQIARSGNHPLFDNYREVRPLPTSVDYFGLGQASPDSYNQPTRLSLYRDGTLVISLTTLHKSTNEHGTLATHYIDPEIIQERLDQAWSFATRWWAKQSAGKYQSLVYNLALYNLEGRTVAPTPVGQISNYSYPPRGKPDPLIVYDTARLLERKGLNLSKLINHSVEMLKLRFNSG